MFFSCLGGNIWDDFEEDYGYADIISSQGEQLENKVYMSLLVRGFCLRLTQTMLYSHRRWLQKVEENTV